MRLRLELALAILIFGGVTMLAVQISALSEIDWNAIGAGVALQLILSFVGLLLFVLGTIFALIVVTFLLPKQ